MAVSPAPLQDHASHAEMQLGSYPTVIVPEAKEMEQEGSREPSCLGIWERRLAWKLLCD